MTTNLRLKNPTSRAYIFERLLLCVFNQINNFIMALIEAVKQKTKLRDSETSWPKIRESETQRNTRLIPNASEISRFEQKFPRPWIFRVPFATPSFFCQSSEEMGSASNIGCKLFYVSLCSKSIGSKIELKWLDLLSKEKRYYPIKFDVKLETF